MYLCSMKCTPCPRSGKALIDASRVFALEDRARSWFQVGVTLGALVIAIGVAARAPWWPVRIVAGALEAGVLVRTFILYHDYMHGAMLRGSPLATALFHAIGVLMLNPPRAWADTHNVHHANTARLAAPATGTFALWSVDRWRAATWGPKLAYRLERNPATLFFAHVTVFLGGMTLAPFFARPGRHVLGGLAAALHIALSLAAWRVFGPGVLATAMLGPFFLACMAGAYLFYAQHNAPGITVRTDETWTHAEAALEGSTFLQTGPVMGWFTGNIGFHHVHHLNARIPFYRLPEAMAALPELQHPVVTSLRPRDVIACLRLGLWDPTLKRLVSFREARQAAGVHVGLPSAA